MTETACSFGLSPRVRFRAVGDDGVLIHLESGRVVVINDTGLHVVRQLESGAKTEAQLVESLMQEFEVERSQAAADVAEFLRELGEERVLEPESPK
jgi:hypothetical protein